MCGIVAVISKDKKGFWQSDVKIFEQLLFADQFRGTHGTGVIFNNNKNIYTSKAPVDATTFLTHKNWEKVSNRIFKNSDFIVGHNRYATKGELVYKDTHPFSEGSITLVHNGTLYSHKHLKDVSVDSHAICHSFNEIGYKETIKKISGAWALVWVDKKTNSLYFGRNKERPLNLIETKECYILCSEMLMGEWILSRNNISIISKSLLPENTIYRFDLETRQLSSEEVETKSYSYQYDFYPKKDYYNYYNKHTSTPNLGKKIQFYPATISSNGLSSYLTGTYIDKNDDDHEIRYFSSSYEELSNLLKYESLIGIISQSVNVIKDGSSYFILRDIEPGYRSSNFVVMNQKQVSELNTECPYCKAKITETDNIEHSYIETTNGKLTRLCSNCSDWANELETHTNPILAGCSL